MTIEIQALSARDMHKNVAVLNLVMGSQPSSTFYLEISFIPLNSGNFVHEQPLDGQLNCWAGSLIVLYQMTIYLYTT
jgi:hypothetical protein